MSWKAKYVPDERLKGEGEATAIYVDDITGEERSASYRIKYPEGINEFLAQAKVLLQNVVDKKKETDVINAALTEALTSAFGSKL